MTNYLKKKWLCALKSGKFKKRREGLNINNTYCCLGVLGAVCGLTDRQLQDMSSIYTKEKNVLLSEGFLEEVNLSSYEQETLAIINDETDGFDSVIAYIEKNI